MPAVCLAVVTLLAQAQVAGPARPTIHEVNDLRFRCGLNSLYMLLRSYDLSPSLEEIRRELPVTGRGVSLLDLRNAAGRLGLPCEVHRLRPDGSELEKFSPPFVAHLLPSYGGATGHFVLIQEILPPERGGSLSFIDPTTGRSAQFRWNKLPLYWSGYVLVPDRSTWGSSPYLLAANVGFWVMVAFGCWRWQRGKAADRMRAPVAATGTLMAICLALPSHCVGSDGPAPANGKIWRTPEMGGVNCLYLLLRLRGEDVKYEDLEAALRPHARPTTMRMVSEVAGDYNLLLKARRCSPTELAGLPRPSIAPLRDQRHGTGQFVLLFHVPRKPHEKFGLIHLDTAELKELSADEFRRAWSGLVLIPEAKEIDWTLASATNLFILSGFFWYRSRRGGSSLGDAPGKRKLPLVQGENPC